MGAISPLHLLIVLIVALIVIGPRKLPETGAALGKALREFRESSRDEPAAPAPVPGEVPSDTLGSATAEQAGPPQA